MTKTKTRTRKLARLAWGGAAWTIAIALAGCGGGGGGGDTSAPLGVSSSSAATQAGGSTETAAGLTDGNTSIVAVKPGDIGATVTTPRAITLGVPQAVDGARRIALSWSSAGDNVRYAVLLRPNASAPYATVAENVRDTATRIDPGPSWRIDWTQARVKLLGCTAQQRCVESNEQSLVPALASGAVELRSPTKRADLFGTTTVLSGDGRTLVVGAVGHQVNGLDRVGAAHVFELDANGQWALRATLTTTRPESDAIFSSGLAISRDASTIAIGAPGERGNCRYLVPTVGGRCGDNVGAVYVYTRDGRKGWRPQTVLRASNPHTFTSFGSDVALSDDGNWLAVSSPQEAGGSGGVNGDQSNQSKPGSGAVYMFARDSGGRWRQDAYVKASNSDAVDGFGSFALALSGDARVLAVGAYAEASTATGIDGNQADNSAPFQGAVYVFRRQDATGWRQEAYVKAAADGTRPTAPERRFGQSVALNRSGDLLVVGAPADGGVEVPQPPFGSRVEGTGLVYVFGHNAGRWTQLQVLTASNAEGGDEFGSEIALSADGRTLAVGAPNEASANGGINANPNDERARGSGAVYVFMQNDQRKWSQQTYVKLPHPTAGDLVGLYQQGLALDDAGKTLAIGRRDSYDGSQPGAVFVY
ncbi:MAG TPA: FG-GAP repeat protein [Burkholderiaceae bacterium]|nr:FG-GAP repeat protein [Burkholderiaceae bacterium]